MKTTRKDLRNPDAARRVSPRSKTPMNLPTPSPEQDAAVARAYPDGDRPFDVCEIEFAQDAYSWLRTDKLVALVDESTGGIIGYVHRDHADRIAALLNVATL